LIFHSVLNIASHKEWYKSFRTCVSHIGAAAILYVPLMTLSLISCLVILPQSGPFDDGQCIPAFTTCAQPHHL
jgi:hypothetical protein